MNFLRSREILIDCIGQQVQYLCHYIQSSITLSALPDFKHILAQARQRQCVQCASFDEIDYMSSDQCSPQTQEMMDVS